MHESNFHVTVLSYGSNTRDAVGRVSRSWAASDVVATATSSWILAATVSSRPFKPEFQHSSPTFRPGILVAAVVGTSSWRISPAVGNASVDNTNVATTVTSFFATDGKSFVHTFNYSIRNMSKYQMTRLLVHLCFQVSFVGRTRLHRWGSKHGRIRRG
jgi:hypothetical protein